MSFGRRLAEERKKLKMNQTVFGRVGGVTKTSQVNYEASERSPDVEYWQAIAAAGADVQYILTGIPSKPMSEDEKALLDHYRNIDNQAGKGEVVKTAMRSATGATETTQSGTKKAG